MSELPPISKELLDALIARFPLSIPDKADTDREIWIEVGKQQFLAFLKHQFNEQTKNVIEEPYVLR